MNEPSELHDHAAGSPASATPEPWSHPWHDELGLRYHQAIAGKIRCQSAWLETARQNLRRWSAAEPDAPPSQARLEWQRILDHEDFEEILRLMTDATEAGHRRRQSTPFAGILTEGERLTIREQLL